MPPALYCTGAFPSPGSWGEELRGRSRYQLRWASPCKVTSGWLLAVSLNQKEEFCFLKKFFLLLLTYNILLDSGVPLSG